MLIKAQSIELAVTEFDIDISADHGVSYLGPSVDERRNRFDYI